MDLKIISTIMKTAGLFMALFSKNETVRGLGILMLWSSFFVLNYHYSKRFLP